LGSGKVRSDGVTNRMRTFGIVLLLGVLTVASCSPEATRSRGGGPGGDIGNRSAVPQIHGTVNPYFETPRYLGTPTP
jgi:hypothetical protein